uniref:Uncharacterized protein n=1 Tax=Anguilla anguilla TaxID=7936 RepID=A0A0E9XP10_ANGAN
MLSSLASTT